MTTNDQFLKDVHGHNALVALTTYYGAIVSGHLATIAALRARVAELEKPADAVATTDPRSP